MPGGVQASERGDRAGIGGRPVVQDSVLVEDDAVVAPGDVQEVVDPPHGISPKAHAAPDLIRGPVVVVPPLPARPRIGSGAADA